MSAPSNAQVERHIERFSRTWRCPFCRAHAKARKEEYIAPNSGQPAKPVLL